MRSTICCLEYPQFLLASYCHYVVTSLQLAHSSPRTQVHRPVFPPSPARPHRTHFLLPSSSSPLKSKSTHSQADLKFTSPFQPPANNYQFFCLLLRLGKLIHHLQLSRSGNRASLTLSSPFPFSTYLIVFPQPTTLIYHHGG